MKENKFRIWDKEKNKMYQEDEFMLGDSDWKAEWANMLFGDEGYIVMQYIGITDEYNNEVYEHDIILIDTGDKKLPAVVKTYGNGFYVISNKNEKYCLEDLKKEDFEIVGNMYENENILKSLIKKT